MPVALDHLAELTAFRDRDLLDTTLAGALKDLLAPEMLALYRCVGEGETQRWLLRARLCRGDVVASADTLWTDVDQLPLLHSQPERLACLRSQQVLAGTPAAPGLHLTYFPLACARDAEGVVEVYSTAPLDLEAQRLVLGVLRVYCNFQALLDDNERDMLTRLLNRKTFDDCFWRAIALPTAPATALSAPPDPADARRHGTPQSAWLAVIDIDHFKRVNDSFGHLMGDEVLLLLSRLMRSSFRFHDHLFRFGGEEFVVLMRCPNQAGAAAALERLRLNVRGHHFPQVGRITISIGYTQLRAGDTPQAAFERADQAVYYAKQHGRDQACHHAVLVAQGALQDASRTSEVELF
jgi:diguanylate cyclase (GGDEF)-like protein